MNDIRASISCRFQASANACSVCVVTSAIACDILHLHCRYIPASSLQHAVDRNLSSAMQQEEAGSSQHHQRGEHVWVRVIQMSDKNGTENIYDHHDCCITSRQADNEQNTAEELRIRRNE